MLIATTVIIVAIVIIIYTPATEECSVHSGLQIESIIIVVMVTISIKAYHNKIRAAMVRKEFNHFDSLASVIGWSYLPISLTTLHYICSSSSCSDSAKQRRLRLYLGKPRGHILVKAQL